MTCHRFCKATCRRRSLVARDYETSNRGPKRAAWVCANRWTRFCRMDKSIRRESGDKSPHSKAGAPSLRGTFRHARWVRRDLGRDLRRYISHKPCSGCMACGTISRSRWENLKLFRYREPPSFWRLARRPPRWVRGSRIEPNLVRLYGETLTFERWLPL